MDPLHPHDPPVIGAFRLLGRLGEDADVRRYLAEGEDGAAVTLAVVRPGRAAEPGFRTAFARRIEAVRTARSAHLAPLAAAEPHGAAPWAAAFRSGESLSGKGPTGLPDRNALPALALGLARGLADLHAAGAAYGPFTARDVLTGRTGDGEGTTCGNDGAGPGGSGRERGNAGGHGDDGAGRSSSGSGRERGNAGGRGDDGVGRSSSGSGSGREREGGNGGGAGRNGNGVMLAGPVPAADADAAAEDVRSWAEVLVSIAGPEGVPLLLHPLVDLCLNPDPRLRPSAADLVRMLDGPASPPAPATPTATSGHGRPARRPLLPLLAAGLALAAIASTGAVLLRDRATEGTGSAEEAAPTATDTPDCSDATGFAPPENVSGGFAAQDLAFSPDGTLLATSAARHGATLWDWREKTPVAHVSSPDRFPRSPVFSPLGCTVVVLEYRDPENNGLRVVGYDLLTGTATDHFEQEQPMNGPFGRRPAEAKSVAVGPDGRVLVGTYGQQALLFEPDGTEPALFLESSMTHATAFLDADRGAALAGGAITVWDVNTGEALHTVRPTSGFTFVPVPGTDDVVHVVHDRLVRWNTVERVEVASFALPGYDGFENPGVHTLSLDAERGRVFVSWGGQVDGDNAGRSNVWDMATGEDVLPADAQRYHRMAFHPDGGPVAAATGDDTVVLLDPETLEEVDTLFP
ncbi:MULTISPECIES: WD40 repeat domain-containing protein [unclassified Nocardiopsis]|uniref:WD40 repeat domain-containing protein n=1 Tax=Nocardiopsis TaxID=2013 RepID=UPI00387B842E